MDGPVFLRQGPGKSQRPTRRVRRVLVVLAGVLLVSVLYYLINDRATEQGRFDRASASLVVTRRQTADVNRDLALLRHDVAVLGSQVRAASASWRQELAQLQAAQSTLAVVQSDVSQQSSHISNLRFCLGGVQRALNALAVNKHTEAISALNSVALNCVAASNG
jgi:hypothetical protein